MKKDKLRIRDVRDALRRQHFAGLSLANSTVSQLYGTAVSATADLNERFRSSCGDWASVSYVSTNSAVESDGMPVWVAEDVEQVLDGLVEAKIIKERAVWFDKIGMRQNEKWPSLATLHCLGVPVICVPPTRTIEYSRYQIPDRWDAATFDFFTRMENLLRACSICGPRCPLEYDSRLLNIAAALRAWPINEAIMGCASRGAFVSFSTLDRLQYTIAWYQVLLQIALDLGGYGPELLAKSIELYGRALFQPCSTCLSVARQCVREEGTSINCQLLDDTLVALVMQANRFTLPSGTERECMELWSLEGLYRSPGETFNLGKSNPHRLRDLSRKYVSQHMLEEIAANICRGRPSLASCYREGNKWLCALILSNLDEYLQAFGSRRAMFVEEHHSNMLRLLTQLDRPFGDLCYKDSTLEVEGNRCMRSPRCVDRRKGSICLFNELSGVLPPSAVGEFLEDCCFSEAEKRSVLKQAEASFRRRMYSRGIAMLCYEFKRGALRNFGTSLCGSCYRKDRNFEIPFERHVLLGWKAKDETGSGDSGSSQCRSSEEVVYSFITVSSEESSHVQSRGIFCRSDPFYCQKCRASFVRVEIEGSYDLLEIHVNRLLPIATTLGMVYDALSKCHEV